MRRSGTLVRNRSTPISEILLSTSLPRGSYSSFFILQAAGSIGSSGERESQSMAQSERFCTRRSSSTRLMVTTAGRCAGNWDKQNKNKTKQAIGPN